jgi:hypothetical protein
MPHASGAETAQDSVGTILFALARIGRNQGFIETRGGGWWNAPAQAPEGFGDSFSQTGHGVDTANSVQS